MSRDYSIEVTDTQVRIMLSIDISRVLYGVDCVVLCEAIYDKVHNGDVCSAMSRCIERVNRCVGVGE